MRVRRVVTGHDSFGRSVVTDDRVIEPVVLLAAPDHEYFQLWGADCAPTLPDDGTQPPAVDYFPPNGGTRFCIVTTPPQQAGTIRQQAANREVHRRDLQEKLPGLTAYAERGGHGMHTTPTVDYLVMLSGSIDLELDDGATVTLRPGDTVVQNGTRHRWLNATDEPATMAIFLWGVPHISPSTR